MLICNILQVRQKLLNTRKRMEDELAGHPPSEEEWFQSTAELAKPLLACYWSRAGKLQAGHMLLFWELAWSGPILIEAAHGDRPASPVGGTPSPCRRPCRDRGLHAPAQPSAFWTLCRFGGR